MSPYTATLIAFTSYWQGKISSCIAANRGRNTDLDFAKALEACKQPRTPEALIAIAHYLNPTLGEEALAQFIQRFSRIEDREECRELQLLVRAGHLAKHPPLWFHHGAPVRPWEAAAKLQPLLYEHGLLADDLAQVREDIRKMILKYYAREPGYGEIRELAQILDLLIEGQPLKLVDNRLETIAQCSTRLTDEVLARGMAHDARVRAVYERISALGINADVLEYSTEEPSQERDTGEELRRA